jgi:hypothetical protein
MDFELPVIFNDKELLFQGRFLDYGYSSKIEMDIEGTKVLFEPDEERNWRALISFEDMQANKNLDKDLLKVIAEAIDAITIGPGRQSKDS